MFCLFGVEGWHLLTYRCRFVSLGWWLTSTILLKLVLLSLSHVWFENRTCFKGSKLILLVGQKQVRFSNQTCLSESETFISKGMDASPQPKQTNLYRCGSEEVALTLVTENLGQNLWRTHSGVYRHALACKNVEMTAIFMQLRLKMAKIRTK